MGLPLVSNVLLVPSEAVFAGSSGLDSEIEAALTRPISPDDPIPDGCCGTARRALEGMRH